MVRVSVRLGLVWCFGLELRLLNFSDLSLVSCVKLLWRYFRPTGADVVFSQSSFGRYVDASRTYTICDINNHTIALERGNEMLDLGVTFDEKLTFRECMDAKILATVLLVKSYISCHS